jgi:Fumarylacetoacetate (FAA) hydrolase family
MGHRISPPDRGDKVEGCLFFLADSITFGYGVNDDETFPYQVGLKSHGRFRVVNLAVNGYGAEHMLATMERDDLALSPCEPTYIFYVAAPHHVLRAAGKVPELTYGPRYRLGPKGIPEYLGTKPPPPKWRRWRDRLHDQLSKSQIYRALPDRIRTTEEDVELYFAIVREAFSRFKRRWPKAELHVIAWDLHDHHSNGQARFHQGLETVGAKFISLTTSFRATRRIRRDTHFTDSTSTPILWPTRWSLPSSSRRSYRLREAPERAACPDGPQGGNHLFGVPVREPQTNGGRGGGQHGNGGLPRIFFPNPDAIPAGIIRHNGKVWEDFASADQIWDTASWIEELSRYTTLHPGDVLWMGIQGADGDMVAGDVIEVEISDIGVLRNYVVVAEGAS